MLKADDRCLNFMLERSLEKQTVHDMCPLHYNKHILLTKNRCALAEIVKRAKFCIAILLHIFYMMSCEKIRRFEEKEDIFENSEFTCFCKFLRSGKFLHVRLIIVIK